MLWCGGGAGNAARARVNCALKNFMELYPILKMSIDSELAKACQNRDK
jgi:hypothetical protein